MCGKCDSSCKSCVGKKADQCTECAEGKWMTSDGTCLDQCPALTYEIIESKSCGCCNKLCSICTGKHIDECSACIDTATLIETTCYDEWDVQAYRNTIDTESGVPILSQLNKIKR